VSALVLANFPIAFLIFAAMVGIPLWLIFKHPDKAPDYSHATAGAQTSRAGRTAGPAAARRHVAAHTPVPGRVHATAQRTARSHETAAQRDRVPA
jgi:hypothetical protein